MGRELQKRKRRSSRPTIRMPNRRKKALNPLGNSIIAKSWFVPIFIYFFPLPFPSLPCKLTNSFGARNKKETLSQNYTRFGLVAKLGKATGGTAAGDRALLSASTSDPLAVRSADQGLLQVREVRVERDADGRITRVLRDSNPLDDPLRGLDSDDDDDDDDEGETRNNKNKNNSSSSRARPQAGDGGEGSKEEGGGGEEEEEEEEDGRPEVVRALEREAAEWASGEKKTRHQSERELEWLRRLVARHGDDTAAMARDMRLNPMQQTAADIARRLRKAGLLASSS